MTAVSVRITPAWAVGQWMLNAVSKLPRVGPGALFSAAGGVLLLMMLQVSTGWAGVATGTAMVAVPSGLIVGVKRHPQTTGVAASSLLWLVLLAGAGLTLSPFVVGGGVPPFVVVYVLLLAAVTASVFLSPHAGIHTGWSVGLAQGTVMLPLPVSVFLPGSSWELVALPAAFVTSLTFARRRARKATRPTAKGRLRRQASNAARGCGFALVILIGATSVMSVTPPEANALPSFGIGDFFEDKANDLICSFTRPDLTGETVGTGPEGFIPSKNLGQVKRSETEESADEVPGWSDQAGDYDRLGQNNSMDAYTLYEIAGLRGIKWVNWQKDQDGKEKCSIMPWASVMVGNLIFKVSTYVLQVTIALKEWSQSSNPLQFLYDKTTPLVADLFNYLFLPMAGIMFMLAALMVALRAMGSGGAREALSNVGGSAIALFLAGLLYGGVAGASWADPNGNGFFMVAKIADETVGQMNSGIAEIAFKSLDTTTGGEMMCQPPQALPSNTANGSESQAAVPGQRYSSCILAEALAYRPWARGQFGSVANNPMLPAEKTTRFGNPSLAARADPEVTSNDDPEGQGLPCYNNYRGCEDMRTYLIAQEGGPDITVARAHCLNEKSDWERLAQCDPYHAVAYQLGLLEKSEDASTEARANRALYAYRAQGSMPHVSQAFAALIGTFCVTAGIAAIAAITLWWHAMLFVMFLLGPLKLLWAAYPGKVSVAREYLLDCMNTFGMRLAYGVLSTLMILLIAIVFASSLNTGLKILWSVFVLTMMWKALKKVQEVATIKGSTTQGPAGQVSKTGMIVGGLAGYGAAKGTAKAASGTAKMSGRAARGTARHYGLPDRTRNAGKQAWESADNKVGSAVGGTGRNVGAAGSKVAKAIGRGTSVITGPAQGPARERAQRVSLTTRATAARTRSTVGSAVASSGPVSRLADVAASTRQAGSTVIREGRGVVATVIPRVYATEMTDTQRDWVDRWTGQSRLSGSRRTAAAAHEEQQFANRMRTDRMARRRENYEAGRQSRNRTNRSGDL